MGAPTMRTYEMLQLGVAVLLPLGLIVTLVLNTARQHGRTRNEIAVGLAAIVSCFIGIVATALTLQAFRGGPLFDYQRGGLSLANIRPVDAVGLALCAALLVTALWVGKWLTRGAQASEDEPDG